MVSPLDTLGVLLARFLVRRASKCSSHQQLHLIIEGSIFRQLDAYRPE